MPKLLEFQAKELMERFGIKVPMGRVVATVAEAVDAAAQTGYPVAIKAQVRAGGRGMAGGIKFAAGAAELEAAAGDLLGSRVKGFEVQKLLVEQKLPIPQEFYLGIFSDPAARKPVVIFTGSGGMEVENSLVTGAGVLKQEVNILRGLKEEEARDICRRAGLSGEETVIMARVMLQLYELYRRMDCTLVEINPLLILEGNAYALDAKVCIDDDSVFRHQDLDFLATGEEVGDRLPTELEKIAGQIDAGDHRGSAHFIQIDPDGRSGSGRIPIGFDGVGTGASLVTMDELMELGFAPVNFCDTSGNPTASKLYRATRVILAQEGIKGYVFVSCLSSQQLDNTARGIVKAFKEVFPVTGGRPDIPCVFAFRGAWDEAARGIFQDHGLLDSPLVRVLGRDATERSIAAEFANLYKEGRGAWPVNLLSAPLFSGGTITIDLAQCRLCTTQACVAACSLPYMGNIMAVIDGLPAFKAEPAAIRKGACPECLGCESACSLQGRGALRIDLPMPELDAWLARTGGK